MPVDPKVESKGADRKAGCLEHAVKSKCKLYIYIVSKLCVRVFLASFLLIFHSRKTPLKATR